MNPLTFKQMVGEQEETIVGREKQGVFLKKVSPQTGNEN